MVALLLHPNRCGRNPNPKISPPSFRISRTSSWVGWLRFFFIQTAVVRIRILKFLPLFQDLWNVLLGWVNLARRFLRNSSSRSWGRESLDGVPKAPAMMPGDTRQGSPERKPRVEGTPWQEGFTGSMHNQQRVTSILLGQPTE